MSYKARNTSWAILLEPLQAVRILNFLPKYDFAVASTGGGLRVPAYIATPSGIARLLNDAAAGEMHALKAMSLAYWPVGDSC